MGLLFFTRNDDDVVYVQKHAKIPKKLHYLFLLSILLISRVLMKCIQCLPNILSYVRISSHQIEIHGKDTWHMLRMDYEPGNATYRMLQPENHDNTL